MTQVKPDTLYSKAREYMLAAPADIPTPEALALWLSNHTFGGHSWTYEQWLPECQQNWPAWKAHLP